MTESAFTKTSALSYKEHRQQVSADLLQGSEHTLTHFKNFNSLKSVKFYEWIKDHNEALSFI